MQIGIAIAGPECLVELRMYWYRHLECGVFIVGTDILAEREDPREGPCFACFRIVHPTI